ncbi:hypothetical protein HN51_061903, partial [Arachis hypogaea]
MFLFFLTPHFVVICQVSKSSIIVKSIKANIKKLEHFMMRKQNKINAIFKRK